MIKHIIIRNYYSNEIDEIEKGLPKIRRNIQQRSSYLIQNYKARSNQIKLHLQKIDKLQNEVSLKLISIYRNFTKLKECLQIPNVCLISEFLEPIKLCDFFDKIQNLLEKKMPSINHSRLSEPEISKIEEDMTFFDTQNIIENLKLHSKKRKLSLEESKIKSRGTLTKMESVQQKKSYKKSKMSKFNTSIAYMDSSDSSAPLNFSTSFIISILSQNLIF